MDWQIRLIFLYDYICSHYRNDLCFYCERFSNNSHPEFTDEEVITIYLFGVMQKRFEIKQIYDYIEDHLSDWFPNMPSYGGYVQRLNRLSDVFVPLNERIQSDFPQLGVLQNIGLIDSIVSRRAHHHR